MAGRIRDFDWASTPLGPIQDWSERLKSIVDLMLGSPSMMSLVWGPEAILLYNDPFTELLREHGTLALGRSAYETFARSREVFEADVAVGMAGKSSRLLGQRYPVLRNGRLEEAWFDVDYAPVREESGSVAAVLWTLKETTAQRMAEQALRESEARHRLLIESWAQAVWETDASGVVVADSPSWRAYTGQTQEEWFGFGWLDAIHPDDRAYAERQWREAIAVRGRVNAEFRLRAPGGGWRWTNVLAAPILDAEGGIRKWAGINIDIGARKGTEAALRKSEELRRIAIAGGRMGTWRWDLREKLIWGDAAFLDLWGFPPSDEPRSLADFTDRMTPQGQAEMSEMITRAMEASEAFDGQLAIIGGPGNGCWVRWRGRVEAERPWIVNGVSFDVTDQRQAEERLRESERLLAADLVDAQRLRSLAERLVSEESFEAIYDEVLSTTVAITHADAGTIQIYDPATKALKLIASLNFSRTVNDHFHLVDTGSRTACGLALRTGERAFVDFPDEVADLGCQLLVDEGIQSAVAQPLVSRSGTPLGMLNAHWRTPRHRPSDRETRFLDLLARQAADLIEQRRAHNALRESEARQRALVEGVPQLVWRAVDGGHWTWASPQWTTYTGQSEVDSHGHGWLDAYHPDDRAAALKTWHAAEDIGRLEIDARIYHASDGRYRWFQSRATAVRDEFGRIVEWLGTSTDVDDLRAYQERQGVMVAELQHRTRNLLGVVRSISAQTLRNSKTLQEFDVAFSQRLGALSRVQGLLSRSDDEPITLATLLHSELAALGAGEVSERIRTHGPEVRLRKGTVQTFALALHELATNACKYGALANGKGRLKVTWRTYSDESGRRLGLEWREIDLDRSREEQSPTTQAGGYGRELIERALPYALQARTTYQLGATELVCTIDLPLVESVNRKGTGDGDDTGRAPRADR